METRDQGLYSSSNLHFQHGISEFQPLIKILFVLLKSLRESFNITGGTIEKDILLFYLKFMFA